ncbi:MAG: MFS transporter [Thermoleophilia bacterium]
MPAKGATRSRWQILALATGTMVLALGMPMMAMPVLFKEISEDLGLSLVQIGSIWGVGSLAGVVFGLLGGVAGDVGGTRRVLGLACCLAGVLGALRGVSGGFVTLTLTSLLMGVVGSAIPMNVHKAAGQWFSDRSYGKANGVLATGMGVGSTLGALVSASVLSPWLGGWRNVLFFYGAISFVIGILWIVGPREPEPVGGTRGDAPGGGFRDALAAVAPNRRFWLLAGISLFFGAFHQGFTGYLSLYLSASGWTQINADSALSVFSAASVLGVIPLTLVAERWGARRMILGAATFVGCAGAVSVSIRAGSFVWPVVAGIGLFREAFMAIIITMIVQTEGIGPRYAGTALGLSMSLGRVGAFIAPPLGNSLASFSLGAPFLLWAGLAGVGFMLTLLARSESTGRLEHLELKVGGTT